jgi:hypothetical protein
MRPLIAVALLLAFGLAQVRPEIVSPRPGEALQGRVTITGASNAIGFASYELAFAYPSDPTGTWFLIAQSERPVQEGTLGEWDTTLVTDGNYTLRLRVFLDDGSSLEVLVPDVRVRNYTPVETPTAGPAPVFPTRTPFAFAPSLPGPTSTPLPVNPAALTSERLRAGLGYGALAMLSLLILLSAYLFLRRRS